MKTTKHRAATADQDRRKLLQFGTGSALGTLTRRTGAGVLAGMALNWRFMQGKVGHALALGALGSACSGDDGGGSTPRTAGANICSYTAWGTSVCVLTSDFQNNSSRISIE